MACIAAHGWGVCEHLHLLSSDVEKAQGAGKKVKGSPGGASSSSSFIKALKDWNSLFSAAAFTLSTRLVSSLRVVALLSVQSAAYRTTWTLSGNGRPLVVEHIYLEPQSMQDLHKDFLAHYLVSNLSVAKSSSGFAASLRTVSAPLTNRRTCAQHNTACLTEDGQCLFICALPYNCKL